MATRRQYSPDFKLEAVRQVKERGVSVAQAARELGLHPSVLRRWVKELSAGPPHEIAEVAPATLEPQGWRRRWQRAEVFKSRRARIYAFFIGILAILLAVSYVLANLRFLLWPLVRHTVRLLDFLAMLIVAGIATSLVLLRLARLKASRQALSFSTWLGLHVLFSYSLVVAAFHFGERVAYLYLSPLVPLALYPLEIAAALLMPLIAAAAGRSRLLTKMFQRKDGSLLRYILISSLVLAAVAGTCITFSPIIFGLYSAVSAQMWLQVAVIAFLSVAVALLFFALHRINEKQAPRRVAGRMDKA